MRIVNFSRIPLRIFVLAAILLTFPGIDGEETKTGNLFALSFTNLFPIYC